LGQQGVAEGEGTGLTSVGHNTLAVAGHRQRQNDPAGPTWRISDREDGRRVDNFSSTVERCSDRTSPSSCSDPLLLFSDNGPAARRPCLRSLLPFPPLSFSSTAVDASLFVSTHCPSSVKGNRVAREIGEPTTYRKTPVCKYTSQGGFHNGDVSDSMPVTPSPWVLSVIRQPTSSTSSKAPSRHIPKLRSNELDRLDREGHRVSFLRASTMQRRKTRARPGEEDPTLEERNRLLFSL
jgi:hypothetical protein